ncbi:MAG: sigma-70 family RNA polymerase sigma factor [Planctomycetes bacterium]|nr:sigma-70 family RNA polymerase sigma factor [Planctomycetota bacterium]MCB9830519.1 sigma-70 family RNA polymerase sigma factor [Planctomycetota bacterium]MCB9902109.1 sigma-70 family RNA polymerase sigma factor [Planctomycetota bacterium]
MPTADRPSPDVTLWLERARQGDAQALEQALEHLYAEIKSIAQARMRAFAPSHTLQPTALVNEAMLRLVGRSTPWESRGHFLGVAARAMRSILADHARARGAQKRGGNRKREPLDAAVAWFEENRVDLLALDDALKRFAQLDARAAQIVELRYFAGLTQAEIAEMLDVSVATVERDWVAARGWLQRELSKGVS